MRRLYIHLKTSPDVCIVAVEVTLLCRTSTQWQHVVTMACWGLWRLVIYPEVIISCCTACCTGQCGISNPGAWLHTCLWPFQSASPLGFLKPELRYWPVNWLDISTMYQAQQRLQAESYFINSVHTFAASIFVTNFVEAASISPNYS